MAALQQQRRRQRQQQQLRYSRRNHRNCIIHRHIIHSIHSMDIHTHSIRIHIHTRIHIMERQRQQRISDNYWTVAPIAMRAAWIWMRWMMMMIMIAALSLILILMSMSDRKRCSCSSFSVQPAATGATSIIKHGPATTDATAISLFRPWSVVVVDGVNQHCTRIIDCKYTQRS